MPVVLAILRKTKIYAIPNRIDRNDDVSNPYKKWDLAARLMCIPFAALSAYAVWLLLCAIEAKRVSLLGPADFVLTPFRVFFATPAIIAGTLLAAIPLRLVLTAILGESEVDQVVSYSDKRQGINSNRLCRHLVYVMVPLVVASVLLGFQTYATANAKGLVIHPYFALRERSYGWTDVQRIALVKSFRAPNGTIRRDRQYYVITMMGGVQLNFHKSILEIPFSDQRRLAAFVADHSHVQVEINDPYP